MALHPPRVKGQQDERRMLDQIERVVNEKVCEEEEEDDSERTESTALYLMLCFLSCS